jgi:osmotically inducible lipoprotein OsmB
MRTRLLFGNDRCLRRSVPKGLTGAVAVAAVLVLSGCGTDPGDRALSGGMIGAAGGAIIGAATGTAATGAAIGAVSGAAIGALTNPCDLDLGSPYWRHHGGRREYHRRCDRHDD